MTTTKETYECEQGHAHRTEDAMDNCDDRTFAARRRAKHLAWITTRTATYDDEFVPDGPDADVIEQPQAEQAIRTATAYEHQEYGWDTVTAGRADVGECEMCGKTAPRVFSSEYDREECLDCFNTKEGIDLG